MRPHYLILDMDLQSINVVSNNEWAVFRGKGVLSFVYHICSSGSPLEQFSGALSQSVWLLALLRTLNRIGLCLNFSFKNRHWIFSPLRKLGYFLSQEFTVLLAVFILFRIPGNAQCNYFFSQLVRCGLIGVISNYSADKNVLYGLFKHLVVKYHKTRRESLFCIVRQLLALGIFRERGEIYYHYYYRYQSEVSVRSLLTEFFQNPLSLLQLSRAAIRQLLGMNDFERSVQTLPLPPVRHCSSSCAWGANEMLFDEEAS